MASILPAFSSIVRTNKYTIPVGQLTIDWTHPLTNGLVACYVPGISGGINRTGFGANMVGTGAPQFIPNSDGPGLDTQAIGKYYSAVAPALIKTWTAGSIFWHGYKYAGNWPGWVGLLSLDYDASGTSPNFVLSLSGQSGTTTVWFGTNVAGTQVHVSYDSGTSAQMMSFGGSFTSGLQTIYFNGKNASSQTLGAGAPNTTATTQVSIGFDSVTPGGNGLHNTSIGCIWRRSLSDNEQLQMALDPYGFLIPAEYDMPSLFSTAVVVTYAFGSNSNITQSVFAIGV